MDFSYSLGSGVGETVVVVGGGVVAIVVAPRRRLKNECVKTAGDWVGAGLGGVGDGDGVADGLDDFWDAIRARSDAAFTLNQLLRGIYAEQRNHVHARLRDRLMVTNAFASASTIKFSMDI